MCKATASTYAFGSHLDVRERSDKNQILKTGTYKHYYYC